MQTNRYQLPTAGMAAAFNGIHWNDLIKKVFRTVQIHVPFLRNFRIAIQRLVRIITDSPAETDFDALQLIPGMDNGLAIDIGANRGDTIQSIQMRTKNTRVMAFEPNPLIFSRLNRMYKGRSDVRLFNFGLGDKDEIVALNVPFYKDFMFDGLASFNVTAALGWLRGRIFFYKEKYLRLRRIECCLTTLDRFDLNPTFIKIDVQGFEDRVLDGAIQTIHRCRPVLLIETPSSRVVRLMQNLNYDAYRYDRKRLCQGIGDLNTFFIPAEKAISIVTPASKPS